jgi:hypothetical protein
MTIHASAGALGTSLFPPALIGFLFPQLAAYAFGVWIVLAVIFVAQNTRLVREVIHSA